MKVFTRYSRVTLPKIQYKIYTWWQYFLRLRFYNFYLRYYFDKYKQANNLSGCFKSYLNTVKETVFFNIDSFALNFSNFYWSKLLLHDFCTTEFR